MVTNNINRSVVLAADDDEDARILLKRAFAKSSVDATLNLVQDGSEAIAYLTGDGKFADRATYPLPNLLLLDLKMPKCTGFEVLEYISKQPELQTFPVVVFTTSNADSDVKRAYALGCRAYVMKPTDFDKLIQLVKAVDAEFLHPKSPGASPADPSIPAFSRLTIPAPSPTAPRHPNVVNPPTPRADPANIYQLLVEQVKDYGIFMLDPKGQILTWNEGARRIQGFESEEIIGQHFSVFYPQSDKDIDKPAFELRMAQEMGRYEEEGWRLRKDGSRFWANVVLTPLRDKAGNLTGFAKIIRDLTQRKLQEDSIQKLLESEERFRLLVDQVRDYAIFILDAKGNIVSWNQGARRLKGYTADEVLGKHFSIFYTPQDLAKDHPTKELSIAIRDGRYEEEGWRIRKDGSRFWANVVITALWDKRGNLTGFAKVTRDLTQRKQQDDELRHKTEELEGFAHTLSHDLRAPLRTITSFAQILGAEELSPADRAAYTSKIAKSAQSMEALIIDVLKLSQLTLGPVPEQPVSLQEILEESLEMLESAITKSKARIELKKPLPRVIANRTLLIQIFSNLLANAIKFVPAGKAPKIEVFSVEKNGECEVHVKDSGIGIPAKYQESIFNVFERGNVESDFGGTGIGLAIVRKAAKRIGGNVTVKSKEGEGSDFVVTLYCSSSAPVPTVSG